MLKAVTGGSGGGGASGITIGTSVITNGTDTRVLFDDAGVVGESAGLTYTRASGLLASTVLSIGSATIGSYALAIQGAASILDTTSWTIPTLNPPGYLPPQLVVASQGASRQGLVLATASAAGNNTITMMASAGTLAAPTAQSGAGMAINFMNYVGGGVAAWRTFAIIEAGNRGGPPNSEATVLGRIQLGAVNGTGTNPRPGVVVYNDSVSITDTVPLWLYRTGHANVYDGGVVTDYERAQGVWSGTTFNFGTAAAGTGTLRDMTLTGANLIASPAASSVFDVRNSTNPMRERIFNTYTSATSNEFFDVDWQSVVGTAMVGTDKGSGGGAGRTWRVKVGGTPVAQFDTNNGLLVQRDYQVAWSSDAAFGTADLRAYRAAAGQLKLDNGASNSIIFAPTGTNVVGLGGGTSSFPALKRSTTSLQVRLADDSAFTNIQGKLTTDVNATTGLGAGVLAALTNASITVTDASGQVYRVPCII